jgi:NAD(P)-dependent dehydrogenase (short-subunit alcohol dehydrogenase family)
LDGDARPPAQWTHRYLGQLREHTMDLSDQRVVVIGGTSGIGLAIAEASSRAGARVVVASSRQSSVDSALARLDARATGQVVDVLDGAGLTTFFASLGEVDHLVYTAGEALRLMTIADLDLHRARGFFETRYFGALNAVHAAAASLRPGGSITLTSGSAGERPGAGWALGASICGAMNSLTRALAVELAPIRVNAVAPGIVRSPLWDELSADDREGLYAQTAASLLVGRVGEVEDIAQAYLYCMTQGYGTGAVVPVDGGALLV